MATNTYVQLDKKTVASDVASVEFTNINQSYTDLVLVISMKSSYTGDAGNGARFQFNGDTGANYSDINMRGSGSTAFTYRVTGSTYLQAGLLPSSGGVTPSGYFGNATINFQNYSNSTTYKTVSSRTNSVYASVEASIGTWRNTAAITSIKYFGDGNILAGSTFSLYGIQKGAALATTAKATGGTITYASDGYTYHTFTSSGTFTPSANITCDYLVVAGGGGGSRINAGGGAGGLRSTVDMTGGGASLESALALTSGTGYTVTVGAGGAGGTATGGSNGSNSVFGSITSIGGGGGGPYIGPGGGSSNGYSGGSGGGAGFNEGTAVNSGGTATSAQGFAGGATTLLYTSGGGGGAGGPGAAGITYAPAGAGGIGARIPTFAAATGTGVSNYYAGGGGAGDEDYATRSGIGGLGGGGNGADRTGSSTRLAGSTGTTNTGSGGGGGENGGTNGYAGGSGIVIIRYAN